MLKKLIAFIFLACSLFLTPAISFALNCGDTDSEGNVVKAVPLPDGHGCCCTIVSDPQATVENLKCKPTLLVDKEEVDANGNKKVKKVCPENQTRVSSGSSPKKSPTCPCELVIEK